MLKRIDNYLYSLSRPKILLFSFLAVFIIGYIDHLISPRVSLSVFYAIPVSGAAWYINRTGGLIVSFIAAAVWLVADITSGYGYAHFLIPYWNSIVRLSFFVIITMLLTVVRKRLEFEENLADTDHLTGLENRRSFYERVDAERYRSRRYAKPLTIIYIDVDNFKKVNDSLGHDEGDQLLKAVAETIRDNVRQSDVVSRLGGDEFAGLFPETDFSESETVISNIAGSLIKSMSRNSWPVTFSIGAITFHNSLESCRDMIKAVDDVMYEVKKQNKNNVIHRQLQ